MVGRGTLDWWVKNIASSGWGGYGPDGRQRWVELLIFGRRRRTIPSYLTKFSALDFRWLQLLANTGDQDRLDAEECHSQDSLRHRWTWCVDRQGGDRWDKVEYHGKIGWAARACGSDI